jgi:hypothetical protein
MTDISDVILNVSKIITYDNFVRWFTPVRYIFIIFSILLGIGILYFAIFTDYLYLKYFVSFDEYYIWKARKKREKQKEVKPPQPLMTQEFKINEEDVFSKEEPAPVKEWQKIFERLEKGREIDCKLAIIEADKIVNRKFDDMGILGRNLRDKMENLPGEIIKKIGKLDSARQVLDDLLKNDHLTINKETALKTIDIYQKAYMNLLS